MKKNNFVEGTIIATLAIVFVKLLGMLYVIPFYNIVGRDGGALYSYGYNIYMIFLGISSAGLPDAISKIISEYNAKGMMDAKNRAYKIARKLISIISVIAFICLFVFAEEIGRFILGDLKGTNTYKDIAFVIRCISPAVLLIPVLSITKGYLQGHKFISPSSFSQLIEQIIRIFVILSGSYLVLKVFDGGLPLAIGIAVAGAFFGGLAAIVYLRKSIKKNPELNIKEYEKDSVTNKEITKKIIAYAIPFVIINVVATIYTSTDQILVLRTLNHLKLDPSDIEFIASSISTWAPKIGMIVNAMAMGLTMSLVPNIVDAFAKKDKKEVKDKVNKSISMILYISLPLSLEISILAKSVWTSFYGYSEIGTTILRFAIWIPLLGNLYMVISTICQSINKYKLVYFISFLGFFLNAILDIPFILLFNKVKIPAYLGSIVASLVGYSISSLIGLIVLRKDKCLSFKQIIINTLKTLLPAIVMTAVLVPFNILVPFNETTRLGAILCIIVNALIGGFIYIFLSIKTGIIQEIFGKEYLNRIVKKLTLGKLSIN